MLVFDDIAALWDLPMNNKSLLCSLQNATPKGWSDDVFTPGRQYSVMVLDCERLTWRFSDIVKEYKAGKFSYSQLMFHMCVLADSDIGDHMPPEWNHLEMFEAGATKLLHFTVGHTQPWLSSKNSLNSLWIKCFREALNDGQVTKEDVLRNIRSGYARPSLLKELNVNCFRRGYCAVLYLFRRGIRAVLRRVC